MSSNDHDGDDDGRDLDREVFVVGFLLYLTGLALIQVVLGILTTSANVVTAAVLFLTVVLGTVIWIRGDIPAEWLFAVFVMKPVALIQQKFDSWKLNWRARKQNPDQQTPFVTLLNALHSVKNQLAKLISQIVAAISKRIASNTATAESTPTDDTATETTDDDTETTNE